MTSIRSADCCQRSVVATVLNASWLPKESIILMRGTFQVTTFGGGVVEILKIFGGGFENFRDPGGQCSMGGL